MWNLQNVQTDLTPNQMDDLATLKVQAKDIENITNAFSLGYFDVTGQEDITEILNILIENVKEGTEIMMPSNARLKVSGEINLNYHQNLGILINLNGSTLILDTDVSTLKMGKPLSGIKNGTIAPYTGFTGVAIDVVHQNITQNHFKKIENVSIRTLSQTGTALRLISDDNEFITFLTVNNLNIDRFENGILLDCVSLNGNSFINGNIFNNIFITGQSKNDIILRSTDVEGCEVSGNVFSNIQLQYNTNTEKHLIITDRCNYNQFIGFMPWDSGGAGRLLFNIQGKNNTIQGLLPLSGGETDISDDNLFIGIVDTGTQQHLLKLGSKEISDTKNTEKVYTFDTEDLGILDARNGSVMKEGTVVSGTRLTNVSQGAEGMELKIKFGGNTLLSNAWGGIGQFRLKNDSSRTPNNGELCYFIYLDNIWYEH